MKFICAAAVAAIIAGTVPAFAKEEAHGLSQADQKFLQDSTEGNLAEVHMGTLATSLGSTPAVREFGRWMVSTHSFANRELATIVERLHGRKAPLDRDPKAEQEMGKLQNLKGAAFDKAYLEALEKSHRKALTETEAEAKSGEADLVKSFAANFAPAMKEHLAQAKLLMAEGGNGNRGAAEADANMNAANGGMTSKVDTGNRQGAAAREQHQK